MRAIIFDWENMTPDDRFSLMGMGTLNLKSALKTAIEGKLYKSHTVEARDRNELFEILNIRHPEDYRDRSMSCGDLAIEDDGTVWVCMSCGWEKLSALIHPAYEKGLTSLCVCSRPCRVCSRPESDRVHHLNTGTDGTWGHAFTTL